MMHRLTTSLCAAVVAAPVWAQSPQSEIDALYDTLKLDEIIAVMNVEGTAYGESIATDLFPERADGDWAATVARIYALERMEDRVKKDFADLAADMDIEPIIAFFETDLGREIVTLEVSAREALLDDAVTEAAEEAAALALLDETPRAEQIRRFIEANDLIEQNVVGAMNANYAFYTGLLDGGGFGQDISEEQILADVWAQEDDIRGNTSEWIYSFLLMAYQPLSDEDLETYIAFSEEEPGQALNRLLFQSFDGLFVDISRDLGLAASRQMQGADL